MAINRPASSDNKPRISEKARQRPVRVIPADDRAEMEAGHLIGAGNRFSSPDMTRADSDSKEGFGPLGGVSGGVRGAEADEDNDQGTPDDDDTADGR